jgi:two-component system cell cycle response regulator DivK
MPKRSQKQKPKQRTKPKQRILVVEDEPQVRALYATLLNDAGFEVNTAEHALSAVCSMVREKPDLILADIRMPIVDGFSFVSDIRSHSDTKDIPVIVVTGLDTWEARETAREAGCNGYMTKPINPACFAEQIKDFLSPRGTKATRARKRARSPASRARPGGR